MEQIIRGEYAENVERSDFQYTEVNAVRRAVLAIEQAAARERMSQGGKGAKISHPLVTDSQGKERIVDRIGAFANLSGRTVEKIAAATPQPPSPRSTKSSSSHGLRWTCLAFDRSWPWFRSLPGPARTILELALGGSVWE